MSETSVYSSPAYKRSRLAYLVECAFEYFVAFLVEDAFLSRLLRSIGFDDAACGLIASVISLAFLFQLVSVFVVRRITNTKKTAIIVHAAAQLLFTSLYLIPFLPFTAGWKKCITVLCLLAAYFCNYLVTVVIYRWANGFVEPSGRAKYSATKEMISLLSGIGVSLLLGWIMDHYEGIGQLEKGFLFAAAAMLVFVIGDVVCLLKIQNERRDDGGTGTVTPMKEILRGTLGNPRFRRVTVLFAVFEISRYTLVGFLGTFKQFDLGYSLAMIQVINMAGSIIRSALSRPFGRFSDKHSYIKGIELATLLIIASYAAVMFTTDETRWLIWVYAILNAVSVAGYSQNFLNVTYCYVDPKYFAEATAIKNSIGGLCGFLAALASGRLLSFIQQNGNTLFGLPVYGQQVQAAIALILAVVSLLYAHFIVGRQEITGK